MTKQRRILIEVLAPPLLSALWAAVFSHHEAEKTSDFLIGSCVLVGFAYLFGILPSIVYAIAMELWFYLGLRARLGVLATMVWSGILGTLSTYFSSAVGAWLGYLVPSASSYYLIAGAVIGLLVGFYVGRSKTSGA